MEAKLHRQHGAFKVNFTGDNGEEGSVWLSYLPNAGTLVVRIHGTHGNGEIEIEDYTERKK